MSDITPTPDDKNLQPTQATERIDATGDATGGATDGATPAEKAKRRAPKKGLLIGGAALGALLLVGGGVAVGAAIADDDDDQLFSQPASVQQNGDDRQGSGGGDSRDGAGPSGSFSGGTTDAAELTDAIEAASGAAAGTPVSIDWARDGWVVELVDGTAETDVLVADGTATVIENDDDNDSDDAYRGTLDEATVESIVEAATAAASGTITSIHLEDDNNVDYVVELRDGDRETELDLDGSFAVVATDTED